MINLSFFYVYNFPSGIFYSIHTTTYTYFKKQRFTSQRNLHVVLFCITGIHSFTEAKKVAILITKIFKDIAEEYGELENTHTNIFINYIA